MTTPLDRLRWERENNSFARTATITDDTLDLVEEALERMSFTARAIMASVRLGSWMSAALDDPKVCEEMKADIREWFAAGEAFGAMAELDQQGHRDDCAIRLPHPASICTCHIADKQRAETFATSSSPAPFAAGGAL